eukprot:jgi/Chrzof1/6666/Cz19g05010.t1
MSRLYFDGASRPNPGWGGCGYVLRYPTGQVSAARAIPLGDDITSNEAEYYGLINGLQRIIDHQLNISYLRILGDSELVVNQINSVYQVRSTRLLPLYLRVRELLAELEQLPCRWRISHIPRERNGFADSLANEGYARNFQ